MHSPEIDSSMEAIASYIKERLNQAIAQVYPNVVCVRSTACYNSLPRDLSSFPLLKVYRVSDSFSTSENITQAIIGYCLSFPEEERIPGILRWVARQINLLLREWAIAHSGCASRIEYNGVFKADYRTMTLNSEPLYSLLQISFTLIEEGIYE